MSQTASFVSIYLCCHTATSWPCSSLIPLHDGRGVRKLPLIERKDLLMVLIMAAGDDWLHLSDGRPVDHTGRANKDAGDVRCQSPRWITSGQCTANQDGCGGSQPPLFAFQRNRPHRVLGCSAACNAPQLTIATHAMPVLRIKAWMKAR
jgi:hypothetical protein